MYNLEVKTKKILVKKFFWLIPILLLLLLGTVILNQRINLSTSGSHTTNQLLPSKSEWKAYQNQYFKFDYPSSWELKNDPSTCAHCYGLVDPASSHLTQDKYGNALTIYDNSIGGYFRVAKDSDRLAEDPYSYANYLRYPPLSLIRDYPLIFIQKMSDGKNMDIVEISDPNIQGNKEYIFANQNILLSLQFQYNQKTIDSQTLDHVVRSVVLY